MSIIKITNGRISAQISTLGAQLVSLKKYDKEYLKTEKTKEWEDSAPVLFPICGSLKDNKYIFKEKEYFLNEHGFAKESEFEIEEQKDDSVVFLLVSDEKTLACYPFNFEFRVSFILTEDTLKVEFKISNTGQNSMYFSVGSHEGYICPGGIDGYSIIFEKEENLSLSLLDGVLLNGKKKSMGKGVKCLTLTYDYYKDIDTLIFENINSKALWLKSNDGITSVKVEYPDAENLLIWTAPGEEYICIEPWSGLPDFINSDYDFINKPGIINLDAGKTTERCHYITIEE